MEPTKQNQPQLSDSIASPTAPGSSESGQTVGDKVSKAAHRIREQVEDRGAETIDQAKRKVSQVYDRANRSMNAQYEKARGYGRENPGKTTLLAFGVGVGVGLIVAGSLSGPRNRRGRMYESVMNGLSTFAHDLFR
jgi:ElaB/YqjD/DUF883 family membrane-anchored ribosome-binding protein